MFWMAFEIKLNQSGSTVWLWSPDGQGSTICHVYYYAKETGYLVDTGCIGHGSLKSEQMSKRYNNFISFLL